jgi:hypothetical protein
VNAQLILRRGMQSYVFRLALLLDNITSASSRATYKQVNRDLTLLDHSALTQFQ